VAAAVLLPAGFVGLHAEGLFFAEADGVEISGRNAEVDKVLLDGVGAAIAKGEVVFSGAAFVAVAFDGDVSEWVALEEGSGLFESYAGVRTNVGLIEIEVSVTHFPGEEFFKGGTFGLFNDRSGDIDGDADVGISAAAGTAGGDGIRGGFSRRDGGGALRSDGANFRTDGDVGGVGGGPSKLGGFALVDGGAIGGDAHGRLGGDRGRGRRRRRRQRLFFVATDDEQKNGGSEDEKCAIKRGVRVIHSCPPKTPKKSIVERNPPEGESYHRRQGSGNISPYDILYLGVGKKAREENKGS